MDARPAQLRYLADDAFCACGYNLRAIRIDDDGGVTCPECGTSTNDVAGKYLWDADPAWLVQVRAGVIRMIFAHFAYVPALIAAEILARGRSPFAAMPWVMPVMLQALAVQCMLAPEPGVRRSTRDDRRARRALTIVHVWLGLEIVRCGDQIVRALQPPAASASSMFGLLQLAPAVAYASWTALVAAIMVQWACRLRAACFAHVIRATWLVLAFSTIWPSLTPLLYQWFGLLIGYRLIEFADFLNTISVHVAGAALLLLWIALNLAIDGVDLKLRRAHGVDLDRKPPIASVPLIPALCLPRRV